MTKRVHTPAKLSRRRNENWPPLSCRRGKWMLRRSWLACEPGVGQGRRARDVRKALRAPGAPGRARRSQLRPGLRKPPSPTAPTGLRPPQVPFKARHSPARDGSAPRTSRAPLPGKWREAARSPCPPRGGSPRVPGPAGLFAGWSWRGDGGWRPKGTDGVGRGVANWAPWQLSEKERAARSGGACGGRELGRRRAGAAPPRPRRGRQPLPSSRPRSAARGPGRESGPRAGGQLRV